MRRCTNNEPCGTLPGEDAGHDELVIAALIKNLGCPKCDRKVDTIEFSMANQGAKVECSAASTSDLGAHLV